MDLINTIFSKFGNIQTLKQYFKKEDADRLILENSQCCGLYTKTVPFVAQSTGNKVSVSYPFEIYGIAIDSHKKFAQVLENNLGVGYIAYKINSRYAVIKTSQNKAELVNNILNIVVTNL